MYPSEKIEIELLKAMTDSEITPASITETVPIKMDSIEMGFVCFTFQADDRHLNPMRGVHGGFATTVLDS